ncbi:MAG: NFACT family protein, partial [Ruminococcus sp.]|nr:NFACT family protein [Ruminococcus sp.]
KAVNAYPQAELAKLAEAVIEEGEKLKRRELCYTMLATPEGLLKDFCFTKIRHFGSLMEQRQAESACALLDDFYSSRDRLERIKQKAQDLFRLLTSLSERTARRIANQRQELKECADR